VLLLFCIDSLSFNPEWRDSPDISVLLIEPFARPACASLERAGRLTYGRRDSMRPLSVAPTRTRLICTLLAMSMAAACGDSPSGLADANLAASVTGAGVDPSAICSPLVTVPFYADNGAALVGTVQVGNDDSMLYVTLTTQSGWTMNRSHVFAGESPAGIPTSKAGNAVPGKFQLKQNHGTSTTSYTYGIPLSTLDTGAPVVLAVHADVLLGDRREGAWGDGLDGQAISAGGSWGTFFEYTVGSCASELITVIDGGLIVYQNLQFSVPSGSVPSDVIITAVPIDVNDLSPSSPAVSADGTTDAAHSLNFDAVLRIAGTGWDMGPDGLTFNTPARITLAYDETRLPPGVSEAQLKIFIINGIFDELPSTVDAVNNTVSADVNHFTSFFIGATLPGTDLVVSRFAELADPVKLGNQAEYSTDIMNLGPDAASGAVVTYVAFGDVALTQIVPTCTEIQNPIFGDVAVSCPVNRAIPSGGTEGAPSFLVEPQSVGNITVWASVSPVVGESDPDFSNNRLENTTTIEPAVVADLSVSRFVELADPVKLGSQAEYSTDVRNLGPDAASGAIVTYAAFGDVALTQIVPTCTEIQNPIFGNVAVSCPINRAIPAGGTEGAPSFLVEAQSVGSITVWASVSPIAGETDPSFANNRLENTTTIEPTVLVDLTVSRFVELADPIMLGDQAEYSTDVMNLGPDAASGASVTYVAFGDVALTQIVPTCTEIQNPIFGNVAVSCPVNRAIPSGGTEGAPSFLVEPQSAGTITVWATVSPVSGETDTNSSNNRLENTTTTNPASAFAGMVAFVSDRDGSRDLVRSSTSASNRARTTFMVPPMSFCATTR
jgi:hypothetical protein